MLDQQFAVVVVVVAADDWNDLFISIAVAVAADCFSSIRSSNRGLKTLPDNV